MCRAPKPCLNENIFSLQDGASALPTHHDDCGVDAVAERLKPLRISSPQGQPGASSPPKWSCAVRRHIHIRHITYYIDIISTM
ncbi:hypothetical protein evm_002959 [Chilo suppressalis]|nr:hypothetical protein evm_002959 [Chilo suppressalis]